MNSSLSFPVWRTVELPGNGSCDLYLAQLKTADIQIGFYATDILARITYATQPETVNLVRLSVKDMGFNSYATTTHIFAKAKELGLELCPAEVGPALRLAYRDQPIDEWLIIGMEPGADRDGSPGVFYVDRSPGGLWLYGGFAGPDEKWSPDDQFLFRLRK